MFQTSRCEEDQFLATALEDVSNLVERMEVVTCGGRPTVKINDERNRWDHIFTDKFGHVNPKESHSQERFKKLFVRVANEGVNRTDGRAKKAQEHGDFAFKIDFRRCPVHVLVSKDGYIKSAYKAIGKND